MNGSKFDNAGELMALWWGSPDERGRILHEGSPRKCPADLPSAHGWSRYTLAQKLYFGMTKSECFASYKERPSDWRGYAGLRLDGFLPSAIFFSGLTHGGFSYDPQPAEQDPPEGNLPGGWEYTGEIRAPVDGDWYQIVNAETGPVPAVGEFLAEMKSSPGRRRIVRKIAKPEPERINGLTLAEAKTVAADGGAQNHERRERGLETWGRA